MAYILTNSLFIWMKIPFWGKKKVKKNKGVSDRILWTATKKL